MFAAWHFPSLRPNMNGIHQFDVLLLQTHAVELLVGALQTLLGLLGFQEILQTFIKIALSLVGGWCQMTECQPRAGADAEETITRISHMASPENKQQRVCWRHHVCSGNPCWDSGFCEAVGAAAAFLAEKWNTVVQTISLWRHQGFLPATTVRYPPLPSFLSLPLH